MKTKLRRSMLVAACVGALAIAGCAAGPASDGGIVGTGNTINCESPPKKDGTPAQTSEACRR